MKKHLGVTLSMQEWSTLSKSNVSYSHEICKYGCKKSCIHVEGHDEPT